MEINSDEIDKLKKGLNPDNYANNREDIHINEEKYKKNFDVNDINSKNNNKKEEKDNIENEKTEQKNENEINNEINKESNIKNDNNNENINEKENISEKLNNRIDSSSEREKGEFKENNQSEENKEEIKEEENIQELIPLSYRCLNNSHREKYITLDRKKQNLICKNCYLSGALETNLELNQEFIDQYLKEEEQKKLNEQLPQNVIKENSEESKNSENEENIKKSKSNEDENDSKKINDIKCLTFQCENKPYYFCESCQDFICYRCIVQKMNEQTDKSRHYYHDIESVNYEANSFNDDIKLNLDTINKIDLSLDYLINNEKIKAEKIIQKLKDENRIDLMNYIKNINKNISLLFVENNNLLYSNYTQKTFDNSDNNVKDLKLSTVNTKSKIEKMLEELNDIKSSMNNKDISNEEKCEIHQKYIELLKKANSLIKKGNGILQHNKEELDHINNENTKNKYEEEDALSTKILFDNEKSIIQNLLNTNKRQGTYKLNRFVTYKHEGLKYFGFSSLELMCEKDIILCGLFLCGKYLSIRKIKNSDYSTIPLEQRGFLNINIKIYEKDKKEPLIDEDKKLYEVIDINDPIVEIFFEKGIKMKKEVRYIILIENLEKEKFSDIWVGNVLKKYFNVNKETIRCNSSGNVFNFYMPQEHISDFNEFEQGIIEGILYGN
jgi:hypothetical protein